MSEFDARVRPLRESWHRAVEDLGIRVTIDDACIVDEHGKRHPLVAIVHDFGGGMHIFDAFDKGLAQLAWSRGHGYTVLGSGYDDYDRATLIDALNDWSWTGDGAVPEWYSGQPESE